MNAAGGYAMRSTMGLGASTLAWVLLASGLLAGSPALVYAAAAFALITAADIASITFASGRIWMRLSSASLPRGGEFQVAADLEFGGGLGLVYVYIPLPKEFILKTGNNFQVLLLLPWKRKKSCQVCMTAARRGEYPVGPPLMKVVSLCRGFSRALGCSDGALKISVWPRHQLIKRFREQRVFGTTPLPDNSFAFLGMRSNSIKGLREYRPGDGARLVNWRASAKAFSRCADRAPLVNEYEVEGRKAVWLFIDSSPSAAVGTREENSFEYYLEAALSITSCFISRGYRVGMTIFGNEVLVRPDSGKGQIARVLREFVGAKPAVHPEKLVCAVESVKAFLAVDRPLCFILTRPEVDSGGTLDAIRRLRAILGRRSSVCLVAVKWTGWHPRETPDEVFAAKAMDAKVEGAFGPVRAAGAFPILWDSRAQRFGELLALVAAAMPRSRGPR